MTMNKGSSSNFALFFMVIGLISGIVGLSTNYWYQAVKRVKVAFIETKAERHVGLWKTCISSSVGGTLKTNICHKTTDLGDLLKVGEALGIDTGSVDYVKVIQYMEIIAALAGLFGVLLWFAYKGSSNAGTATCLKIFVLCSAIAAGLLHAISAIVWVYHKEKEETTQISFDGDNVDVSFYSWSFGAVCLAGCLQLLSVVPILTSKKIAANDIMTHPLTLRA